MLLFNFTGLKRAYWLPVIAHESDHDGIWFWNLRWLGVEVVMYSRAMGAEFIGRFNRQIAEANKERP